MMGSSHLCLNRLSGSYDLVFIGFPAAEHAPGDSICGFESTVLVSSTRVTAETQTVVPLNSVN